VGQCAPEWDARYPHPGTGGPTDGLVAFDDGLRCAGGMVVRLGVTANVGGTSQYPAPLDAPISVRGMIPAGGGTRVYQCWYRNAAAFCTPSAFNLSNGVEIDWSI
jgi:hypothetical protein